MVRIMTCSAILVAGAMFVGCGSTPPPADPHAAEWEALKTAMVGTFSSRDQAKTDPRNYQDVRLVMTNIWPARTDGYWLYVEQALASDTAHPYRQRVYRLVREDGGTFRCAVFTLPENPLKFSDGTGAPRGLESISVNQLSQRGGCDIVMTARSDGTFAGGTVGRDCPNDLKGAKYSTSVVKVTRDEIVSWDRGYDSANKQVWGAASGGYAFKRERTEKPRASR